MIIIIFQNLQYSKNYFSQIIAINKIELDINFISSSINTNCKIFDYVNLNLLLALLDTKIEKKNLINK